LKSDIDQTIDVFDFTGPLGGPLRPFVAGTAQEQLRHKEPATSASFNQLLSREWSTGNPYRYTYSKLNWLRPTILATFPRVTDLLIHRMETANLHFSHIRAVSTPVANRSGISRTMRAILRHGRARTSCS
jgi:hypothetical protein